MNKNLGKWFLSGLGIISTVFSLVLLFYSPAYANCTVIQSCSGSSSVMCSGADGGCQSTATSVTCTQNDNSKVTCHCGQECTIKKADDEIAGEEGGS